MTPTPTIRSLRKRNDPKIAILPTAPERQVQQNHNRAAWAERSRLREATPWPKDRYVDPGMREARKRAKIMAEVETTPEVVVLLMVLDALPREQRQAMIEQLAPRAIFGGPVRAALELIRSTMLNFGQQWDLMRAQDELRDGGAS